MVGVDAAQYDDEDERYFKKENLKLKAVAGKSVVNEQSIRFYGKDDLTLIDWREYWIRVDIPFNPKQNPEKAKVLNMLLRNNWMINFRSTCQNTFTFEIHRRICYMMLVQKISFW